MFSGYLSKFFVVVEKPQIPLFLNFILLLDGEEGSLTVFAIFLLTYDHNVFVPLYIRKTSL